MMQPAGMTSRQIRRMQARSEQPGRQGGRREREISRENLNIARNLAARLTDAERGRVLEIAHAGFKRLREGVATFNEWACVASAINMAVAIEKQGVIRGMHEHFAAAEKAIDAVWYRVERGEKGSAWGRCTTLYHDEIEAIQTAIALHDAQLQALSVAELNAALETVRRDVRTHRGQEIHRATITTPQPAQEKLL